MRYNFWNIYGPNNEKEKCVFLTCLEEYLKEYGSEGNNILGGDFNVDIDRTSNAKKSQTMLKQFVENCDFVDSWRKKYPRGKRFTWQRYNPKCVSTLDYWFVPLLLENCISECKIFTAPKSDHLAVKMKLNIGNARKGEGVWKFNNSFLQDEEYTLAIANLIQQIQNEYKECLDHRSLWDLIKNQVQCFSISYGKLKNKKSCNITDLEQKVEEYRKDLAKDNTKDNHDKYMKAKLNLELAWTNITNGAKIRSKEKWVQEGEKTQNIFQTWNRKMRYVKQ